MLVVMTAATSSMLGVSLLEKVEAASLPDSSLDSVNAREDIKAKTRLTLGSLETFCLPSWLPSPSDVDIISHNGKSEVVELENA